MPADCAPQAEALRFAVRWLPIPACYVGNGHGERPYFNQAALGVIGQSLVSLHTMEHLRDTLTCAGPPGFETPRRYARVLEDTPGLRAVVGPTERGAVAGTSLDRLYVISLKGARGWSLARAGVKQAVVLSGRSTPGPRLKCPVCPMTSWLYRLLRQLPLAILGGGVVHAFTDAEPPAARRYHRRRRALGGTCRGV